jgi:MYXO-CTERM domain-containing protein
VKTRSFLFLLLSSVVGCSEGLLPVNQSEQGIIGGTADTGDPGVVLVYIKNSTFQGFFVCTGEVLSPHVVLTAAHCVHPDKVGADAVFHIYTGVDVGEADASTLLEVQETHFHPDYDPSSQTRHNDIGVVIVKEALDISPLPPNRDPLTPDLVGSDIRIIGYGITSGSDQQGQSIGVRRQVRSVLDAFDDFLVQVGDPSHMPCEGDSGGPALLEIDGVEKIVGITSFGDAACKQASIDTRVDVFVDSFVQPFIDQFDPATDGTPDGGAAALGADCHDSSECSTHLCATDQSGGGFCTASCSENAAACTGGTECGTIDGQPNCVRKLHHSGCSAAPGGAVPASGAAGLVLMFLALYFFHRRAA